MTACLVSYLIISILVSFLTPSLSSPVSNALILVDIQRCFSGSGTLPVPQADSIVPLARSLARLPFFSRVIATRDSHPHHHVSFASNHLKDKPWLAHSRAKPRHKDLISNPSEVATPFSTIVLAYTENGYLCGYEDAYEMGRLCNGLNLEAIQSFDFTSSSSSSSLVELPQASPYFDPVSNLNYTLVQQTLWPDHCIADSFDSEFHPMLEFQSRVIQLKKGLKPHLDSYSAFADLSRLDRTPLASLLALNSSIDATTHVFVSGLALDYCVFYTALDARLLHQLEVTVIVDASRSIDPDREARALQMMQSTGIQFAQASDIPGFRESFFGGSRNQEL